MTATNRQWNGIVLGIVALCIVASLTGAHGQDKNGGFRAGVIHIDRLQNEYKVIKDFNQQLQQKQNAMRDRLNVYEANPYLAEQDQQKLADLLAMQGTPKGLTAADKTQLQQLQSQSAQYAQQVQTLSSIQNPTPAQKQQIDTFAASKASTDSNVSALATQAKQTFQNDIDQEQVQVKKSINSALTQVAKQEGISIVFSSDIAPYAQIDCTDSVLKILNK